MDYPPSPCFNFEIAFPPVAARLGDEAGFHIFTLSFAAQKKAAKGTSQS
jgi:hypothetical protein